MQSETKTCQNCKNSFIIEPEDFGFYEKIKVPVPMFCFLCRLQRRMMWRNERVYYNRQCDLCRKNIIATYDKTAPFPVYCQKCWWGDDWNPYEYGRDFDFTKPFFEQFKELLYKVPMIGMQNDDGIASKDSEYAQDIAFSKDVYLSVCGWFCEHVYYSWYFCYDKDIVDCSMVSNSELCYQCIESDKCARCLYCFLAFGSLNCAFCVDVKNCMDCFLCAGLRNKKYCVRNIQYSKEDYEKILKSYALNTRSGLRKALKERDDFALKYPKRFSVLLKTTNSTGYFLTNAKNTRHSFYVLGPVENSKYLVYMDQAKDCYDINNSGKPELCYDCVTPDECFQERFCVFCWRNSFCDYSYNCHNGNNIFGSIALKKGEYAILNKKYSKEDFTLLKDKIIEHMKKTGEWGEFFPSNISPFSYNETQAYEHFPLTKDEVLAKGLSWKERELRNYAVDFLVSEVLGTLPSNENEIVGKVIECTNNGKNINTCTTAFRITAYEYGFYKRFDLPLPVLCPNCRYYERLKYKFPPNLYRRQCMCDKKHAHHEGKCPNEFETPYAPERPEIIYCEKCYQQEVY